MRRVTMPLAAVLVLLLLMSAPSVVLADGVAERDNDNSSAVQSDCMPSVDSDGTQQVANLTDQNRNIAEMNGFSDDEDDRLGVQDETDVMLFKQPAERSRAPPQELNQVNVDFDLTPEVNEVDTDDNGSVWHPTNVQKPSLQRGGATGAA